MNTIPRVPLHIRLVVLLFFIGSMIWLCTNIWTGIQLFLYSEAVSGEILAISSSRYPTYQVEIQTPEHQVYTAWLSTFLSTYKVGEVVDLQWVPYQAKTIRFPGFLLKISVTCIVACGVLYLWWSDFVAVVANRYTESLPEGVKKLFRHE